MATIIKNQSQYHSSGNTVGSIAYELTDMAGQAEQYLDSVRAEAARIIQQAKQEEATIRSQAEKAGREAAQEAIERILDEKVAKQMQTLKPALAAAVQQIDDSRQQWLHHWESSVVRLACAIAGKIVRREIQRQPEITLEWITEALRLAGGAAEITLRLHPTDYETLGGQIEQLPEVFQGAAPAKIVADDQVSVGGCRLDTEFGSIDLQIEAQLARIEQEIS